MSSLPLDGRRSSLARRPPPSAQAAGRIGSALVPSGWSPPLAARRRARLRRHYANLTLWTLQGWLALFYLAAGYAKLAEPMDLLVHLMGWPATVSPAVVRTVGGVEIALALLSLIPWRTSRFGPATLDWPTTALLLTAVAFGAHHAMAGAAGLALTNLALVVMAGAILFVRRGPPARRTNNGDPARAERR